MENIMMKEMSQFMSGIQRTIVNDKITRGESLNEVKRPMSFSVYENMCKNLYEGDDDEYLFAHAFLTIEWNLMARDDNCVNMHVNHVQRQDDCFLLFFEKNPDWRCIRQNLECLLKSKFTPSLSCFGSC